MSASQGRDSGTWASDQLNADKPRQQTKQSRQAAFWRTWPLLWVIAAWAAIAFVLFITVGLLIWWLFINDPLTPGADLFVGENGADPLKFVQTILAIVGGVGAVGYLVIKYRERSDAESSKADQRLLEAVTQLGSDSPQVRIAGVYALADIADTFQGPYKQRVVDILCGYLRTDRSVGSESQSPALEMRIQLRKKLRMGSIAEMGNRPARSNDVATESTVISVIAAHVKRGVSEKLSWSECVFDFHGAHIHEDVNFVDSKWGAEVRFDGAVFYGWVDFSKSSMCSEFSCVDSVFSKGASFFMSEFEGRLSLERAVFCGDVGFGWVEFASDAVFYRVKFSGNSSFLEAVFREGAVFEESSFYGDADFEFAKFFGYSNFKKSFFGGASIFEGISFGGYAIFEGAVFVDVSFDGSEFLFYVTFEGARFGSSSTFCEVDYGGNVDRLTEFQLEWEIENYPDDFEDWDSRSLSK